MSQTNVDFSDNPTGSELMDNYLAREQENSLTSNSGIQRPSYAKAGTKWLDTSVEPWVLKMYTGSGDVVIGYIDKTKGTFQTATDTEAVRKTGNEDISGVKTFYDTIIRNTAFASGSSYTIRAVDINGKGSIGIIPYYTGNTIYNRIITKNTTSGKDFYFDVIVKDDGTARIFSDGSATNKSAIFTNLNNFLVPTPERGDNSQKAVNTAYLNSKFQVVNELPSSPDESVFYYIAE